MLGAGFCLTQKSETEKRMKNEGRPQPAQVGRQRALVMAHQRHPRMLHLLRVKPGSSSDQGPESRPSLFIRLPRNLLSSRVPYYF